MLSACSTNLGESAGDAGHTLDSSHVTTDSGLDASVEDAGNGNDADVPMDSSTPPDTGVDTGVPTLDAGVTDFGTLPGDAGPPLVARFYVATDGNDSNPGTMEQPFATWDRLASAGMLPGELAYIRGGTYHSTRGDAAGVHVLFEEMHGSAGNEIRIWAYPGERPVLDLSTVATTATDPHGMLLLNSSYVHIKGLRVTNLRQEPHGGGIPRGVTIYGSNNCILEFIESDNIGGPGFKLEHSNNNLLKNCDAHNTGDGLTDDGADAWDNSDGFSISGGDTSTGNVFDGCRAWFNSDDGWDFFDTNGVNTLTHCWAFWNGYKPWGNTAFSVGTPTMNDPTVFRVEANGYGAGNGEGFKLGPAHTRDYATVTKTMSFSVGFENRDMGFCANSPAALTTPMVFYNNASFGNNNDGFAFGGGWSAGFTHIFKNNWSWDNNRVNPGGDFLYDGTTGANISNNSWDIPLTVSAADFESVSSVGVDGPRGADGSLPVVAFLHLVASSDLLNAGTNVGLPFSGSAPDVGPFER